PNSCSSWRSVRGIQCPYPYAAAVSCTDPPPDPPAPEAFGFPPGSLFWLPEPRSPARSSAGLRTDPVPGSSYPPQMPVPEDPPPYRDVCTQTCPCLCGSPGYFWR